MNETLVFAPHLPHFFPEPLLGLKDGTLEGDEVIGVLRPGDIAEVRLHESGSVLEGALQIGPAAQELRLLDEQLLLPFGSPSNPRAGHILTRDGARGYR